MGLPPTDIFERRRASLLDQVRLYRSLRLSVLQRYIAVVLFLAFLLSLSLSLSLSLFHVDTSQMDFTRHHFRLAVPGIPFQRSSGPNFGP